MDGSTYYNVVWLFDVKNKFIQNDTIYLLANRKASFFSYDQLLKQYGNKLFLKTDSNIANDKLLVDFDSNIDDTLYNLYNMGDTYHAKVLNKDSTLLSNGEYNHFMELNAFYVIGPGEINRNFTWSEKLLDCWKYNLPIEDWSISYPGDIYNCTSDPLFGNGSCWECTTQAGFEEQNLVKLKFYPNPVYHNLEFEFVSDSEKTIKIFDLQGKELLKQHVNSKEINIDLAHLQTGFYFVELIQGKDKIVKSFVKE